LFSFFLFQPTQINFELLIVQGHVFSTASWVFLTDAIARYILAGWTRRTAAHLGRADFVDSVTGISSDYGTNLKLRAAVSAVVEAFFGL
jgi:hypothetical protein